MALLDTHRPLGSAQGVAGRIATFATGLVAAVVEWDDVRRTRNALRQLTAHELDDLGLSIADVETIGSNHRR